MIETNDCQCITRSNAIFICHIDSDFDLVVNACIFHFDFCSIFIWKFVWLRSRDSMRFKSIQIQFDCQSFHYYSLKTLDPNKFSTTFLLFVVNRVYISIWLNINRDGRTKCENQVSFMLSSRPMTKMKSKQKDHNNGRIWRCDSERPIWQLT